VNGGIEPQWIIIFAVWDTRRNVDRRQRVGRWGEEIAACFLSKKGFEIISRNVRTSYGEIDLIVKDGEEIIFVEVKTRTTDSFGTPEESVTRRKLEHLVNSIQAFLQEHTEFSGAWRIDVLAIQGTPGIGASRIEWFQNVGS
jgi:putative endonuclease